MLFNSLFSPSVYIFDKKTHVHLLVLTEGHDERVPGVVPELPGREDDGEGAEVEDGAEDDDGHVETDEQVVERLGDAQLPDDVVECLESVD